jgi:hypothetical protein
MVYVVTKVTPTLHMPNGATVCSKRNFTLAQKESASFLALNFTKLTHVQQHPVQKNLLHQTSPYTWGVGYKFIYVPD